MILSLVKKNLVKILAVSIVSAASGVANIWLLKLANDYALGVEDMQRSIMVYAAALMGMVIIGFTSQYFLTRLSTYVFYRIRQQLAEKISQLAYSHLEAIGSHRLYTALTHDIGVLNGLVALLPNYIFNFTIAIACLVYMGTISLEVLGMMAGLLLFSLWVSRVFIVKRGERRFKEAREIQDELFKCYEAIVDGCKELRFNPERRKRFYAEDLDQASIEYRRKSMQAGVYWNLANNWNVGILFFAIGAIVFISQSLVPMTTDATLRFVVVALYMAGPTTVLMNSFRDFGRVRVVVNKLNELQISEGFQALGDIQKEFEFGEFQRLELRDAVFQYAAEEGEEIGFSVGPINLEINRGEIVYLIGGNGSGKTTAAKLLSGLYAPSQGAIALNDFEVLKERNNAYQQYFSTIFPDYYLFDRIVNKQGNPISDEELQKLRRKLKLPDELEITDQRFSTLRLSQGQKKRLALLQAYFEDSQIYVFDEWAAEQDPEFREFFYQSFLPELKQRGKTLIVITHDDRYFHLADKLVKFERGQMRILKSDVVDATPQGNTGNLVSLNKGVTSTGEEHVEMV